MAKKKVSLKVTGVAHTWLRGHAAKVTLDYSTSEGALYLYNIRPGDKLTIQIHKDRK